MPRKSNFLHRYIVPIGIGSAIIGSGILYNSYQRKIEREECKSLEDAIISWGKIKNSKEIKSKDLLDEIENFLEIKKIRQKELGCKGSSFGKRRRSKRKSKKSRRRSRR